MKELDIIGIIQENFGDRIAFLEEERMPTIYDILRSPKYNDLVRRQQKSNAISYGFTVAKICVVYKGIRMAIEFTLPFDFYNEFIDGDLNREGRVIVPITDLDEITIEEPKFANKTNRKWFYNKIRSKPSTFSHTSLLCQGHRKYHSRIGIRPRIISYVGYLLDAIDFAKDAR